MQKYIFCKLNAPVFFFIIWTSMCGAFCHLFALRKCSLSVWRNSNLLIVHTVRTFAILSNHINTRSIRTYVCIAILLLKYRHIPTNIYCVYCRCGPMTLRCVVVEYFWCIFLDSLQNSSDIEKIILFFVAKISGIMQLLAILV